MPGVRNFRDLGGYQTQDGRRIKKGLLFRSGHLADLSPRGLDNLSDIGLSTIIDLRSAYEAERRPGRIPQGSRYIHLPIMDEANREMSREIRGRIEDNRIDGFDPSYLILKAYQQFPTEFTPQYKTFMHAIRDAGSAPVLWHCTAGKDRTGYAAAILLRTLGVDQGIIYQDYLLSNQYVKRMNKWIFKAVVARGLKAYRMIRPLMGVQEDWLKASFDSIDREWGSFEAYVKKGLDLNASEIREMKDRLLE